MKTAMLLITLTAQVAMAQTFGTTTALPAAIPDGSFFCTTAGSVTFTIPVSGVGASANAVALNFSMSTRHTWYGDLRCTLTSPHAVSSVVMASACDGSLDDASDLVGPYTLADGAAQTFDAAALAAANTANVAVPSGAYAPDNPMNQLLACGADGTWTVTFQDFIAGDTGLVGSLSLSFTVSGAVVRSFTICQGGAGAPLNLIHRGGTAGAAYLNPATINTPSAASGGWVFGLNIPVPLLLQELSFAPPVFSGVLDASGSSLVSIPGIAPGTTIQIVGIHLDPVAFTPIYASTPVNYVVL